MGRRGEAVAAWFLTGHGLEVIGRNLTVAGGEIDLVAMDGHERVVIEVRSTQGQDDPIDRVDAAKRHRVRRLAVRSGADRVDFVGVRFDGRGVDVHWVPG